MVIQEKNTDNNRFVSLSKFNYTPFSTGLKETIEWYCDEMKKGGSQIRTTPKY
jgi:dTDP-D-glucose 4,6-dehydratase